MKKSSIYVRREVPLVIASVFLLLQVAEYFLDIPVIDNAAATVGIWLIIISAFAFGLAIISILIIHGNRLLKQKGDWISSALIIGSMIVVLILGLLPPLAQHPLFNWMYQFVIYPLVLLTTR